MAAVLNGRCRRRALLSLATLGVGCARLQLRGEPAATSTVLAVQAFLDERTDASIRALWRRLSDERIDPAPVRLGLRPHMTMASWILPAASAALPARLESAARALAPMSLRLRLQERSDGERGFYLSPEAPAAVRGFHAKLHRLLGPMGTPQRQMDLPGSFWPHVSLTYLFTPADRDRAAGACADLAGGVAAHLMHLGLVAFAPVRTVAVFPLTGAT